MHNVCRRRPVSCLCEWCVDIPESARNAIANDQKFPPGAHERRVPQYGPAWVAHVLAGGAVRNGNILIGELS